MLCPLSAVVGDDVKATSINFEKSADDSTWQSATVTGTVNYIDTAISGNSALAQCDVSQGQTQWTWIRGELSGQTTDTVPATATSRLQWAGLDTSLAVGYWRVNCVAQGKSYHATISADSELTNGYVTFPITTPDTASYVQDTVVVNKAHDFDGTVVQSGQFPAQPDPTKLNPGIFQLKASDIGAVGAVVTANQIGKTALKQWRSANPLPEDISAWNDSTWLVYSQWMGWVEGIVMVEGHFEGTTVVGKEIWCRPKSDSSNELEFAERVPGSNPAQWITYDTYTLTKDTIFVRTLNFTSNYYYGQAIPLVLGGPTKATFKLNVNTFKSQQGDKDYVGELPYIPSKTVNFSGTYTDNTPFSYDVYYKD